MAKHGNEEPRDALAFTAARNETENAFPEEKQRPRSVQEDEWKDPLSRSLPGTSSLSKRLVNKAPKR